MTLLLLLNSYGHCYAFSFLVFLSLPSCFLRVSLLGFFLLFCLLSAHLSISLFIFLYTQIFCLFLFISLLCLDM